VFCPGLCGWAHRSVLKLHKNQSLSNPFKHK
jgi:hypothetical protein